MPKIEIDCGEAVTIIFKDCDGEITIAYSDPTIAILTGCDPELAKELNSLGGIVVHADMYDSSDRQGIIYHEPVSGPLPDESPEGQP